MSQAKSLVTGLGVALVIGGGGGFALKPLAASGKLENASAAPAAQVPANRVVVEEVTGIARVLVGGDTWRRVRPGDELDRPTVLVTEGPDSSVSVGLKNGSRVVLRHDARASLSLPAGPLAVQLDYGLALVYGKSTPVPVYVPSVQAVMRGEAYGVWAQGDSLVTAVLAGEVTLDTAAVDSKYAKGREIRVSSRGPVPQVLATQLEIEVEKTERVGNKFRISGKTTPNAQVLVRRGSRYEAVELAGGGTFTADLETKEPQLGDIVAYDAAGRRAEVNVPSETLDDVYNALSKGQPIERRTGASLPMPTPTAPREGKAEEAAPAEKKGEPAEKKAAPAEKVDRAKADTPETVAIPVPQVMETAQPAKDDKKAKVEHQPRGSEPAPVKIELPGMPKTEKAAKKGKKGAKAEAAPTEAAPAQKTEPAKTEDPSKPVEVQFE